MNEQQLFRSRCKLITKKLYPIKEDTVCSECGDTFWLSHHHKDCNPANNEPNNVVILCHRCHLRLHRKAGDVGNRSRLTTADIKRIRDKNIPISKLVKEYGYHPSYLNRIRKGDRDPIPADQSRPIVTIPADWRFKDMRGKPRALSIKQVRQILKPQPMLGKKRAEEFATRFQVGIATIWKARSRKGCYADTEYDLPQ